MDNKLYIQAELKGAFPQVEIENISAILFEDISGLDSFSQQRLDEIINRIKAGEPTQYITGIAPFYGYFFNVDDSVLIPRPETEELVFAVEKYIKQKASSTINIIDIGTGSGCIPITLSKLFPKSCMLGLDVSENALFVARSNNTKLKANVSFQSIDFLDEENWKKLDTFDVIISNPPYIPHLEKTLMNSNVLNYEPHLALFVENDDPLIFYKKIHDFALTHSKKTAVFLECNEFNASEVALLFSKSFETEIIQDLQGKDRIVKAIKRE